MNNEIILTKVLILGDAGVGKTNMINRFGKGKFEHDYVSTIGLDLCIKHLKYRDNVFRLQIWDTAGQERFNSIITTYFKGSNIIILCFDMTNKDSFHGMERWVNLVMNNICNKIPMVIVGTKCDLISESVIDKEILNNFMKNYGINDYFETSSKHDINITKIFEKCCDYHIESDGYKNISKNTIILNDDKINLDRNCCVYI